MRSDMQIHHMGFLAADIKKSENLFQQLGYEREQAASYDADRKAYISFWKNEMVRIELIQPDGPESPIYGLLKKYKNTVYHTCYRVDSLADAGAELEKEGYLCVQPPAYAPCIGQGCSVAFYFHKHMGWVELLAEGESK